MATLNLQLIGVIIFLVAALEAQESPATESVAPTEATKAEEATKASEGTGSPEPTTVSATTAGQSSSSPVSVSTPKTSTAPSHLLPTDQPASDSSSLENGGYSFDKPGKHHPGLRHVKAHDGFHSLGKEENWAHWNDAFTTAKP